MTCIINKGVGLKQEGNWHKSREPETFLIRAYLSEDASGKCLLQLCTRRRSNHHKKTCKNPVPVKGLHIECIVAQQVKPPLSTGPELGVAWAERTLLSLPFFFFMLIK